MAVNRQPSSVGMTPRASLLPVGSKILLFLRFPIGIYCLEIFLKYFFNPKAWGFGEDFGVKNVIVVCSLFGNGYELVITDVRIRFDYFESVGCVF